MKLNIPLNSKQRVSDAYIGYPLLLLSVSIAFICIYCFYLYLLPISQSLYRSTSLLRYLYLFFAFCSFSAKSLDALSLFLRASDA